LRQALSTVADAFVNDLFGEVNRNRSSSIGTFEARDRELFRACLRPFFVELLTELAKPGGHPRMGEGFHKAERRVEKD
jgi:hypothetical protein